MAQFTKDTARIDPYKNFKFVVSWDGQPVAGVSSVSGLSRSTEPIEHREGADPITTRVSRGAPMAPVTCTRRTHTTFEWGPTRVVLGNAHQSLRPTPTAPHGAVGNAAHADELFRKDISIAMYNERGRR